MTAIDFPDPRNHEFAEWVLFGEYYYNARDIIEFGGDLTVENLRGAYSRGIFPWHIDRVPLPWFCPEMRAILEFDELHASRSLLKERRRSELTFTIDADFPTIIRSCAETRRRHESGTWITEEFIEAYTLLHETGGAHSVEAFDARGRLVGGLYGVDAGGVFCGESMFHKQPNASKLSLLFLIDHLASRGATWIDIQVMTPHFKALGAKEIPRREFLDKLKDTQDRGLRLF